MNDYYEMGRTNFPAVARAERAQERKRQARKAVAPEIAQMQTAIDKQADVIMLLGKRVRELEQHLEAHKFLVDEEPAYSVAAEG